MLLKAQFGEVLRNEEGPSQSVSPSNLDFFFSALRACLRISNGESKESDNLGIGELLNRYGKNHSH